MYPEYEEQSLKPISFGERLRQIRKEMGETQDEFATRIGTSKQVLSRYEKGRRIPKISLVEGYAKALHVSVDYLMGVTTDESQEAAFEAVCTQSSKPFYKIFIEVTCDWMGLMIPNVVRITGLTDWQVRTIILRRAPLPIALQLSRTLDMHGQGPKDTRRGRSRWRPGK